MHVGFFADSYHPYTSGVVRSIETFAGQLTSLGHEVFIFAPKYPGCKKEAKVFRFMSVPSPTNPEFALALPFSLHLTSTVRNLGLDVIHVHSPFMLGSLGASCARRLEIPLVFTYHTLYDKYVHYVPFARNFSRWVIQKYSRDFCNRCDLVVAPTAAVAQYLKESGVHTPVDVIPTGVDTSEFLYANPAVFRQKHGIDSADRLLLFVGRLGIEKNVSFLLEAFKGIHQRIPASRLVLVGSGPLEGDLREQAASYSLERAVTFTGQLGRRDLIDCYAAADLFVFASVTETQGIVIPEAKAAGLPVVAVNASGVSEMVVEGEDGLLCGLDTDDFQKRVLWLLQNPDERKIMSENALRNAKSLSSQSSAQKLAVAYTQVISRVEKSRLEMTG